MVQRQDSIKQLIEVSSSDPKVSKAGLAFDIDLSTLASPVPVQNKRTVFKVMKENLNSKFDANTSNSSNDKDDQVKYKKWDEPIHNISVSTIIPISDEDMNHNINSPSLVLIESEGLE